MIPFKSVSKKIDQASKEVKAFEIELDVGIACRSAIRSIDHLGEIVKRNGDGSIVGNIRLHRTKCTRLLTNVVAPALREELSEKLRHKKFSVLVDESTDVSSDKHMAVVIWYFNEQRNTISTALAKLAPVSSTKGEILFKALEKCLSDLGLRLADCIGYGLDGAWHIQHDRRA